MFLVFFFGVFVRADRHVSLQLNVPMHTSDVRALEFDGDERLVSAGADKRVQVWNVVQQGQRPFLIHSRTIWWDVEAGPLGRIWDIAVASESANGPAVIFGGQSCRGGNSELVWSGLNDGTQQRYSNNAMQPNFNTASAIDSVSTLSDGSLTAVTNVEGATYLCPYDGPPQLLFSPSIETRQQMKTPLGATTCSAITPRAVYIPQFTHSRLAGQMRLPMWTIAAFDTTTGAKSQPFPGVSHHAVVTAMTASADGRYLAAADLGHDGSGVVHYWNLESGAHSQYPIGDGYGVSLSFCHDGHLLAIGTEGTQGRASRLVVVDVATGRRLVSKVAKSPVVACALSASGNVLAFAQATEILIGQTHQQEFTRITGGNTIIGLGKPTQPAADVSVSTLLGGEEAPRAFEFEVASLTLTEAGVPVQGRPHSVPGWQVQVTNGRLHAIQMQTGKRYLDVPSPGVATASAWLFTPDRKILGLALGTANGDILAYRFNQAAPLRQFTGHAGSVTDLTVSEDGRFLVSSSTDGTTRFWSLEDWHVGAVEKRWGAVFANEANSLVVTSIDDRGPLYHAGVRAGDTLARAIWDEASAQLGIGKQIQIEGHFRNEATTADDVLALLAQAPYTHDLAFYLLRDGNPVRVPVQCKSNWHEVLALYIRNPEWIAWNPSGYYASSPGGERLIGWLVNGRDQIDEKGNPDPSLEKPAPEFHLAIQFRKAMYRPGVIRRLLEFGNLTDALAASARESQLSAEKIASAPVAPADLDLTTPDDDSLVDAGKPTDNDSVPPEQTPIQALPKTNTTANATAATDKRVQQPKRVVDLLPPRIKILSPTTRELTSNETTLVIEAEAISDSRRPVKSMRLMVNSGPDELSVRELDPLTGIAQRGLIREVKFPSQRWEITLGEGVHEFVIRADCGEGEYATYGLSETIRVTYKNSRADMYVLAIGISDYPGELALNYAHLDASGFVKTLKSHAQGSDQPYASVTGKILTNEQATRKNVLEGVTWLREQLKMGDLGVIFFAGHGSREDESFYLLPVDVDLADLKNTAVSQSDIRKFCADTSGGARRLLVIDACYSGALNPAESFRELNSDDFGVFVMTSSKDNERSWEMDDLRGGVFTSWMNRGLAGAARYGDEFVDDWELGKYVLTSVSGFVKKRFNSRQTPLFLRPETSLPFVLTRPTAGRVD